MSAEQLAKNIAEFIKHNDIDIHKVNMEEIVEAYFKAQLKAIEKAGEKVLEAMI